MFLFFSIQIQLTAQNVVVLFESKLLINYLIIEQVKSIVYMEKIT